MGNIKQSKVLPIHNDEEDKLIFICDVNGNIINMSKNVATVLKYNARTLENEFIGIIMSDFMSFLHKRFLISKYHHANKIDKNRIDLKLSAMSSKRPLLIYDIHNNPICVSLYLKNVDNIPINLLDTLAISVNPDDKTTFNSLFLLELYLEQSTGDKLFLNNNYNNTRDFQYTDNNIILIFIDFINSTENLTKMGDIQSAYKHRYFYDTVLFLIRQKYYPYIYIHEVVGDGFVLALNGDWTYNIPQFCANLAMNFIQELFFLTQHIVQIRIGLSYGKILYGLIGNQLRFFGETINLAARLEQQGENGIIIFCENFFKKLLDELALIDTNTSINNRVKKIEYSLKGFGTISCYQYILDPTVNHFIHYNRIDC